MLYMFHPMTLIRLASRTRCGERGAPGARALNKPMKSHLKHLLTLILLLNIPARAFAAIEPLTPVELKQIETARAAVLKLPEVKAATAKFNIARKAYQLDRAKFSTERSKEVALA